MSRCFYTRTAPGEPADWHGRAIVGGSPRPVASWAAFIRGLVTGAVLTLVAVMMLAVIGWVG